MRPSSLAFFSLTTMLVATLHAQQLRELHNGYLRPRAIDAQDLLAADFDNDGDLDLWVAVQSRTVIYDIGRDRLYQNLGGGRFDDVTSASLPVIAEFTYNARAGDVDGDGDLDVVTAGTQLRVYLNDGRARFTEVSATAIPAQARRGGRTVELIDVDQDGDLDLLSVAQTSSLLLLNDGRARFTVGVQPPIHTSARRLVHAFDTHTIDLTGDGTLDLVVTGLGVLLAFRGDGRGGFVELAGLPRVTASIGTIAAADVDGDQDIDLLLPMHGNPTYQRVGVLLLVNDGNGAFTDVTASRFPVVTSMGTTLLADKDGDGDMDAFVSDFAALTLYENDGNGTFRTASAARQPPAEKGTWRSIALDADRDGRLDLVTLSVESPSVQVKLWFGQVGGGFADAARPLLPFRRDAAQAVRLADLDADGDLDMVRANANLMRPLYLNDGSGRFISATTTHMPGITAMSIMNAAIGDVDGDGDPDVLLARFNRTFMLYRNSGTASFTHDPAASIPSPSWWPTDMRLVDLNRDGNLDLVCAVMGQSRLTAQNELYLGDGRGNFAKVTGRLLPLDQQYSQSVAVADVDRDGDLDLFFANLRSVLGNGRDLLYLNDGSGGFRDVSTRLPVTSSSSVEGVFTDADGDGDPDLALATYYGVRLWRNDGRGSFTDVSATALPAHSLQATAIRAVAVVRAGVEDLVFVHKPVGGHARLGFFFNTGSGRFLDQTARVVAQDEIIGRRFAIGDVDEDGDLDLVAARVLVNLERHVQTPLLARVGRPFRIEHHALGAAGHTAAVPMIGLLGLTPKVPVAGLGKLGIDPTVLAFLPTVPLTNGTGRTAFTFPNLPGLVGLRLYAQSLFVAPSIAAWKLSNTTADRIGW